MPKKLFIFIFALFFSFGVVEAQEAENDSAFGDLSGNSDKVITEIENFTVDRYQTSLENYEALLEKYEKSYGTEKEALSKSVLAQGKNILILKLGVFRGRLTEFEEDYKSMNFSEDSTEAVSSLVGAYKAYVDDTFTEVNEAESISELVSLSSEINTTINNNLGLIESYKVEYLIEKSSSLIGSLDDYISLIQRHVVAAKEAGISFEDNEDLFAEAVINLEETEKRLTYLSEQIEVFGVTEEISIEIDDLVDDMISSFYDIESFVTALQYEYGVVPWSLN